MSSEGATRAAANNGAAEPGGLGITTPGANGDRPLTPDPLGILEQRIEAAVAGFEARDDVSWAEVEELLNEGYGRLLSVEAVCARLARQLEEDVPGDAGQQGTAERRELEQFHSTMLGDAERLRGSLRHFKARGLEARRRFARSE